MRMRIRQGFSLAADDSREWLETRIRKLSENAEIEEKINEGEQAE